MRKYNGKVSVVSFAAALFSLMLMFSVFFSPVAVRAASDWIGVDTTTGSPCSPGKLCNPIGSSDINDFIKKVAKAAMQIGVPIAAIFIVFAGFKFVTARGDEKAVTSAKQIFWYTIIGTAILLAAELLVEVLTTTVKQVAG